MSANILQTIHKLLVLGIFYCMFYQALAYMDIEIIKIEQLDEPTYVDYTQLHVKKVNKTRKLFGNTTYHIALDNTYTCEALVYMKQGGEYRLMPYKLKKKAICDFYTEDTMFYAEMCQYSTWKVPFECPQPTGVYSYLGYSPSLKNWPVSIMHTGSYAGEVTVEKDGVAYFRYRMYVSVINV